MTAKTFNAAGTSFEKRIDLLDTIFNNMEEQSASSNGTAGILLAGDPGTGKTSFMRFLSKLTGLSLITIEAPHITEEHIINIPFIVFDPKTDASQHGNSKADASDTYKIVLSDSNLFTHIKSARAMPDAQYQASIAKAPADLRTVYEKLGGTDDEIPEDIQSIRHQYASILFLDEYFRQASTRIRNMLRGILNGKIGSHDLPKNCYVIYASNINDEGVEGIPLNNDFQMVDYGAPEKDEWFHYLTSKFEADKHMKLNSKVVNKFYDILNQEDLSHWDMDAEVRSSPRRWEQLMLYINSSLPCSTEKDAKALMTNVHVNFKNYLTGAQSGLLEKISKAVAELIKETSDVEISANATNSDSEWRDTLAHQIEQKMKLGEHRKYVPVISGPPGIGKTSKMMQLATHENLRYIYIDCSTLDPEDVHGIALANEKGGKISTTFSMPKLYKQIMDDMAEADKEYKASLKSSGDKNALKEYDSARWKYLLFFDELNRTSPKVFNGIRRALLEKDFGDDHKLPEETIVVAAINPDDIGAAELTAHMRDVLDVIGTKPSWKDTYGYLGKIEFPKLYNPLLEERCLEFVNTFANKFKSKNGKSDEQQFHLDVGANPIYISPREYVNLYKTMTRNVDKKLHRVVTDKDFDAENSEHMVMAEKKLRQSIFDSFKYTLNNIFTKHGVDSSVFMHDLQNWVMHSSELNVGEGLFFTKAADSKSAMRDFTGIIDHYYEDPKSDLADNIDFINYVNNTDHHVIKEDFSNFLTTKFDNMKEMVDALPFVSDQKHKRKVLDDAGVLKEENTMITKLEHFIREVVHTIKRHGLSNSLIEQLKLGYRDAYFQFVNNERVFNDSEESSKFTDAISELHKNLMNFFNGKTK